MKKFNYILLIIILLFTPSCSDDFLNLAPVSNINEIGFYKTSEDLELAVNAVYSSLQENGSYGRDLVTVPEMRSDNAQLSWMTGDHESTSIILFEMLTDNARTTNIWTTAYRGIMRSNLVLDRIDEIEMEDTLKDNRIREVKFIRALQYFNLVRLYGEVPLSIKSIESPEDAYEFGRASVDAIYEQIIEDLNAAEQLPVNYSGEDVGRATAGAAKALLGKVYMTRNNFTQAEDILKEVIESGIYDLLPNYNDLWNLSNQNNVESIFEVQFKRGGTGTGSGYSNMFPPKFSAPHTVTFGSADGWNSPTQNMVDAYEENDLRKDISMAEGYYDGDGEWIPDNWVLKFMDEQQSQAYDSENNWPVLRYADVLLMYAEALNEISYVPDGEAFDILNRIRNRAGLDPKTSDNQNPDLRITNQEEFRLAIEHERRVELAFENHRYFDLIRTGRFVEVMNQFYDVQEHQTLFPIPQREIDLNPGVMSQNPGY